MAEKYAGNEEMHIDDKEECVCNAGQDAVVEKVSGEEESEQHQAVNTGRKNIEGCSEHVHEEVRESVLTREPTMSHNYKSATHFVALQITNKEAINNFVHVQEQFLYEHNKFNDSRIPPNGFHLTLAVCWLNDRRDIDRCTEAMDKWKRESWQRIECVTPITFTGVGRKETRLVYANVKCPQIFDSLVCTIKKALAERGLKVEKNTWFPHITLFKVKNSVFRSLEWKKHCPYLNLQHFSEMHFGSQNVDNIQVCEMGTLPTEHGSKQFYHSIWKL